MNNYGWAIILVTFIINICLFPFKLSSLKSARKMQALQPRIQVINANTKTLVCAIRKRQTRIPK